MFSFCLNRKQAIHSEKTFDFLRELVKSVPDHQTEEEMDTSAPSSSGATERKPKVQRSYFFKSLSISLF